MGDALVLDSVTACDAATRGRTVVGGSHGGVYAAYLCARAGAAAVLLNDAGVGLDAAGFGGLPYLQELGVPAATYSHRSARIGDGTDAMARGVVSHVNAGAAALGVAPGMACRDAAARLSAAPAPTGAPPPQREGRQVIDVAGGARAFALDSASLIEAGDAGGIVVTASHGALLGGRPEQPGRVALFAAVFNDADRGVDDAGITRLPALDLRGVAGACVSAWTARIGDGWSSYDTGVVSAVNRTAMAHGARLGMTARAFVALMAEAIGKGASA